MLAEYLAIALRNSRLYGEIAETKRSLEQLIALRRRRHHLDRRPTTASTGWNPAAERIFGLTAGGGASAAASREMFPRATTQQARAAGSRRGAAASRLRRRPPAAPTAALTLAVTLSGAAAAATAGLDGLIAIVRDITAQREVENQLHQSEKLTALGQLAGGIAHDFNNLLQAILGYAQLMKQNLGNAEFIQRSLDVVESAAIDGAETVRRIQQFARLRPDEQFVPVDLNQIVQDAVAITRPRWEEKHRATSSRAARPRPATSATIPPISGRPAALTEVITNLILNAMDAMPERRHARRSRTRHERGRARAS